MLQCGALCNPPPNCFGHLLAVRTLPVSAAPDRNQPKAIRVSCAKLGTHRRRGVKRRIVWVVFGKNGAGVRKVSIKNQMFRWRVVVPNFYAVAVARLN